MFICLPFLFWGNLQAQDPARRTLPNFPQPTDSVPTATEVHEPPDTTPLRFSFCQKPEGLFPDSDTMPDAAFRFYDPARRGYLNKHAAPVAFDFLPTLEWGNLGNPGSAARPMFYQHFPKIGFQTGLHAFDIYETSPDQLRFYRHSRTFSEATYSQGFGRQNDNQFRGRVGRTFSDGMNLAIQADALNGLGQIQNGRNKNAAFTAGLWQQYGPRYEAFLIYARNSHKQQENFGIVEEADLFNGGVPGQGGNQIRVRQESPFPVSSLRKSDLQFTQHLLFLKKKKADAAHPGGTAETAGSDLRLVHSLRYGTETFKFYDKSSSKDSALYGKYWTDERGLRSFFDLKTIENRADLSFSGGKKTGGALTAGLMHQFVRLDRETAVLDFQQLFLTGSAGFRLLGRADLNTAADLGIGQRNGGEYSLRAEAGLDLGPLGNLRGGLLNQRRQPSLVQRGLAVSQVPVYANGFNKIIETTLAVGWSVPRIGLSVTGENHLSNGFVFFNRDQLPEQLGSPLNVSQLVVNQNFRFRGLHLDNRFVFQKTNRTDVLHQPEWASRNSLYFSGKTFHRHMNLAAGADFRINQSFAPDGWQPAGGQFFLQEEKVASYPAVDLFVGMGVKNFRFFLRYEDLSSAWETRVQYQTALFPQPRGYIRFGASFRWMDGKKAASQSQSPSGQPTSRTRPSFGG